ncbi:hypothetical protein MRS44_003822 [Fusarium solani]|uniref:uncharacterized protein n=1 Tax=Fusarium solani TaxID=169388 RepID=UPI0032C48E69|nr:hypothetical protein MRS44_003822 [Fusarium solani]
MYAASCIIAGILAQASLGLAAPPATEMLLPPETMGVATASTETPLPCPSSTASTAELQLSTELELSTASQTAPSATAAGPGLTQQLASADLSSDRYDALQSDDQFVFDFNRTQESPCCKPGIVAANRKTFPALVGTSAGMSVGRIGPCGLNLPHLHPRSSELQIVTEGRLMTETILENGRVVQNELGPYQMTAFYQGLLHAQFNPDCTDAVFVSSFSSEDFGSVSVVDSVALFSDTVIKASFGQSITREKAEELREKMSSETMASVQECLDKCGAGQ